MHRLSDQRPDRVTRIQRSKRVLKNHLDTLACLPQFLALHRSQVFVAKHYLSGGRLIKAYNGAANGCFPRTTFSYQSQGLPAFDTETDAIDRAHIPDYALENNALRQREMHFEVTDIN